MERKQRIRSISKISLVIAGVAAGGWLLWFGASGFLFNSDIFRIRAIEIKGNRNVSANEIVSLLPFREGDNLFKIWLSQATDNVRQCKPELKKITMCRRWHRVLIKIEERAPLACVTLDGQRWGIDEDNIPFPLRGKLSRELLPEIVATPAAERPEVVRFVRMFVPLAKGMFPSLSQLSLEPGNNIVFETGEHLKVYWGQPDESLVAKKLKRLAQVLADAKSRFTGIEYVNLCFFDDGRIIVKPLQSPGTLRVPSPADVKTGTRAGR